MKDASSSFYFTFPVVFLLPTKSILLPSILFGSLNSWVNNGKFFINLALIHKLQNHEF